MEFFRRLFRTGPRLKKVDITRRFDLISRVGQGSMSKVWRARDSMTGQIVALKVLDLVKTKRLDARFIGLKRPSEGEVAVTLKHPNIVKTMEYGYTTKSEQFLVMEYVDGTGLSYLIDAQNNVMKENRLRFMIELADAITFFHSQNWIHRDICPRNIMVDSEYRIKLIDFGLVVPNTEVFQKPGNRTGTANYMAPELIKRQKTDQRIDIFSFAVTCYEMWARRLPWEAGESYEAVMQHINAAPDPIKEFAPEIDDEVAEIIMKGLAVHPADRWQTMAEIGDRLRSIQKRLLEAVQSQKPSPPDSKPAPVVKSAARRQTAPEKKSVAIVPAAPVVETAAESLIATEVEPTSPTPASVEQSAKLPAAPVVESNDPISMDPAGDSAPESQPDPAG